MGQGARGPSWSELRWLPGPVPWGKASNAVLARRPEDSDKVYPPYSVHKDFELDLTMAPSQLAHTSPAAVDAAAQAVHPPKRSKGQSLRALYVRGTVTCGECFKPRAVYGATAPRTLQKARTWRSTSAAGTAAAAAAALSSDASSGSDADAENISLSSDSDSQMSSVAADHNELELDASLLDSVGPGAATADGPSTARSPEAAAETHSLASAAAVPAARHPCKRTARAQARMDLQLHDAPEPAAEGAASTDSGAPAARSAETCQPRKQSRAFGAGKFVYAELGEACGNDQYTFGAVLLSDGHMLAADFYCNAHLTCAAPVKSTLYNLSSSALKQPFVNFQKSTCCICGVAQLSNSHCRDQGCTGGTVKQWRTYPLCSGCADKGFKPLSVSSTKGQSAQRARGQKRSLPAGAEVDPAKFALTDKGEENDSDVSLV